MDKKLTIMRTRRIFKNNLISFSHSVSFPYKGEYNCVNHITLVPCKFSVNRGRKKNNRHILLWGWGICLAATQECWNKCKRRNKKDIHRGMEDWKTKVTVIH